MQLMSQRDSNTMYSLQQNNHHTYIFPVADFYLHAKFHLDPSNRLATIHQRHRQTGQTGQTGQTDRQRTNRIENRFASVHPTIGAMSADVT